MATWRYIKGTEADFQGAPDWALYLVNCWWLEDVEDGSRYISKLGGKQFKLTEGEFHRSCFPILAQRERVTSVNDDRLARDFGVNQLITERGSRYGKFADGAEIMRDLKHVMHEVDGWNNLTPSQKEALDMIQHKVGRILNGDPTYDDNWKDIAGYATLVAEELNGVKK